MSPLECGQDCHGSSKDEKHVTSEATKGEVDYDVGFVGSANGMIPPAHDVGYQRVLPARQIMMMTFGAGIGTGLWVGTGTALYYGRDPCICSVLDVDSFI
jgi:amino acid permease